MAWINLTSVRSQLNTFDRHNKPVHLRKLYIQRSIPHLEASRNNYPTAWLGVSEAGNDRAIFSECEEAIERHEMTRGRDRAKPKLLHAKLALSIHPANELVIFYCRLVARTEVSANVLCT